MQKNYELSSFSLDFGVYVVRFYAGGGGLDVDRYMESMESGDADRTDNCLTLFNTF